MGYSDPKQAIIASLVRPRATVAWQSAPSPGGWRAAISHGGGHDADSSTLRFRKQRGIQGREIHPVTFGDQEGRNYRFQVGVVQGIDGWEASGMAGGGEGDPPRNKPWVNFCGWGWPQSFHGGGWLTGEGSEAAARARLRFQSGPTLEDAVGDRVVLFITNARVGLPATAEILAAGGALLATQSAF